jgi:tryptophan-rich sensory protein
MARRSLVVLLFTLWSVAPLVAVAFQVAPRPTALARPALHAPQANRIKATGATLASTADGQTEKSTQVDYDALVKYHASIVIQMSIFALSLTALDALVESTGLQVPFPAVVALFYGVSLKSRIFNPLNNARPNMPQAANEEKTSGFRDRVMPSWTPPGVIFPIMWLLIIGPLRAYSSALVYETTGHFMHPAIFAFLFHLSVGDVWNTINNTEKRYGASVTGVLCVVASLLNAAYQYHSVDPLAGNLLGLTVIWLSVASSLITATWKLNPDSSGEMDPLYPVVGGSKTEFIWLQK